MNEKERFIFALVNILCESVMKTCRNCGTELSESAIFCHLCGTSEKSTGKLGSINQQVLMPRTIIYLMMFALAIMGLCIIGLTIRGPSTVTQIQYVTKLQLATVSITSSTTMTATSIMTVASIATLSQGTSNPVNQQYCGYPFNPYRCNEGPPVTLTGYLTNDSSCVFLYVGTGQNYVVWNLPSSYPTGAVQVYGFIYPTWPQTQIFPPSPFQTTSCIGTPMWAVPPYIKST
jgi:hypothetical protein